MIESHRKEIVAKTEVLVEDVLGWLGPVRSQWEVLRADREDFVRNFGTSEKKTVNENHFTVVNASIRLEGKVDPKLVERMTALVESRRTRFSAEESKLLKEVLRPLVCHTVIQDLLRYKTGASVLDWKTVSPTTGDSTSRGGRLIRTELWRRRLEACSLWLYPSCAGQRRRRGEISEKQCERQGSPTRRLGSIGQRSTD